MQLNSEYIAFFQIIIAIILGGVVGIERNFAGKTAGMRTYGLVSMSSCLFVIVSELVSRRYINIQNFDFNPIAISTGIITGIGFIGAGLIIFKDSKLSGLTTAAGLWVACAIGIAVGFGLYAIAVFASFLTLFVFTIMWSIEQKITNLAQEERSEEHKS